MPEIAKPQGSSLHVVLTREPFIEFFTITLDNGHTEELDPEECRTWFKERGANMDKLEKVLDHCWNFYYAEVTFENYHEPASSKLPLSPKL